MFFLSIMPLVVDMSRIDALAFAEIGLVMIVVFTPVLVTAAILADRTRRLFRSAKAMRRINQGASSVMAGAALAIATR